MLEILPGLFAYARLLASGVVGLLLVLFVLGVVTGAFSNPGHINISKLQRGVLILVLSLYVAFPHDLIAIGFHSIALAAALAIFLVCQPNRLDWRVLSPYLLFAVPLIVATCLAMLDQGFLENPPKLRALFLGMLASLLFSIYFRKAADAKLFLGLFLPVIIVAAGLGIAQSTTGNSYLINFVYGGYLGERGAGYIVGWGFGYNHLAQGMALMSGIAIALYTLVQYQGNRLLAFVLLMLFVIALLAAPSQGTWIGGLALILAFIVVAPRRRVISARIMLPVVIILTSWGVVDFAIRGVFDPASELGSTALYLPERTRTVLATLEPLTYGSRSLEARATIWRDGIDLFTTSPIWGVGMSNFSLGSSRVTDAHNVFLSILAETGLIGFAGFLLMHVVILLRAYRIDQAIDNDTQLVLPVMLSLIVGYLVVGLFWHLEVNRIYWIALGILNGLSSPRKEPSISPVAPESGGLLRSGTPPLGVVGKRESWAAPVRPQ